MDGFSLALIAIAGVLIVFMFLSSRRRRRDAETQRAKIQPGVEVMTSQGIFGTLLSIDTDKNEAIIETTPGTKLRVHSQTIAKVVEDEVAEEAAVADDIVADEPKAVPRARKKPAE